MLAININILIICGLLMTVALLAPLLSPFFRKRGIVSLLHEGANTAAEEEPQELQPMTVVITTHDNAEDLERNLPKFLHQDYPAGFRVIVVADKSDNDTVDVLKRFAGSQSAASETAIDGNENIKLSAVNAQLYYILLPSSSRYMSRKKLGVTLGVKAAKTEWVLQTDPFCSPASDHWLRKMASKATEDKNLVVGYTCYNQDTPGFMRFERIQTAFYLMRRALGGPACRPLPSNLMFRKAEFLEQEGYKGNLELIRGEYDFIVNKYARPGGTALVLSPDAWMIEDKPNKKTWRDKHLFAIASRPKLCRRKGLSLLYALDQTALHATLLLLLAATAVMGCMQEWMGLGITACALIANVIVNTVVSRSAVKPFDEGLSTSSLYFYQLRILWSRMAMQFRFWHANKLDFTTHKQ